MCASRLPTLMLTSSIWTLRTGPFSEDKTFYPCSVPLDSACSFRWPAMAPSHPPGHKIQECSGALAWTPPPFSPLSLSRWLPQPLRFKCSVYIHYSLNCVSSWCSSWVQIYEANWPHPSLSPWILGWGGQTWSFNFLHPHVFFYWWSA
jgi:hypothetical protein